MVLIYQTARFHTPQDLNLSMYVYRAWEPQISWSSSSLILLLLISFFLLSLHSISPPFFLFSLSSLFPCFVCFYYFFPVFVYYLFPFSFVPPTFHSFQEQLLIKTSSNRHDFCSTIHFSKRNMRTQNELKEHGAFLFCHDGCLYR